MTQLLFANNTNTTIATALTTTTTTVNLLAGSGVLYPNPGAGQAFLLTLTDALTGLLNEIVLVTARSVDTLTIVRAQEGTAARSWLIGDLCENMITAGTANAQIQFSQLASNLGSSYSGYQQGAIGSALINQQSKNQQIIATTEFYANGLSGPLVDPTGIVDSTMGIQAFFNAVTSMGAFGIIIPGTYLISSPITILIGGKGFLIAGSSSTSCVFKIASTFSGGTSALSLLGTSTTQSFILSGFSILPATVGSSGTATTGFQIGNAAVATIAINGFGFSEIKDVTVNNFTKCFSIAHARMICFNQCSAWLIGLSANCDGIYISQNGAFTGDLRFDNCQIVQTNANANTCVNFYSPVGPYNNSNGNFSIAGIKFKSCDFYAGYQAIRMYASAASQISDVWFVDGCQIDQVTYNNVYVESNNSSTLISDLHFDDMYQSKGTNAGMSFTSTGTLGTIKSVWIDNNEMISCPGAAITFYGTGCQDIHVTGNTIVDCANTGAAIDFNGTTGVQCNFNKARTGQLSQLPYYLIGFESGTTNIEAMGNNGLGFVNINTINDASGAIAQKTISSNPGYNPIGVAAVTVGASPFTYKNNTGAPIYGTLSGGTTVTPFVTVLTLSGFGITPTNSMGIGIPQGQSLVITYTGGTPTFNVFGM